MYNRLSLKSVLHVSTYTCSSKGKFIERHTSTEIFTLSLHMHILIEFVYTSLLMTFDRPYYYYHHHHHHRRRRRRRRHLLYAGYLYLYS